MTLAPERSAPLLNDSSDSDFDFSALPDVEVSEAPPEEPESEDVTPETKVCPTCEQSIVRMPGMRGRLPKYHPQCKPSNTRNATSTRKGPNTKAVREADEVIAMLKPKMMQGAIALAIVDKYDGFVFMSMTPQFCDNLRGVLIKYDKLRADALNIKTGGSILGLIITGLMMILPMLAHHGLIPGAKIREILTNMPVMIFKLAQRMKEGEQALSEMMDRVATEMLRQNNAATAAQNGNNASTGAT